MRNKDIYNIATAFRAAIMDAKFDGRFHSKDRMSNFPRGCCDDSCDLLAYYLYTEYNIHTRQVIGTYRDKNPYNTTNHAWLVMDNNTIVDITGDQFAVLVGFNEEVYVGKKNSFYKRLERERKQISENYNIVQDARLWNDYKIIMSYVSEKNF